MVYYLALQLQKSIHFLNVVHYISFRALAALLTSLLFSFIWGSWFIEKSRQFFRSKAREYTPDAHKAKDDMPTMGGIFIIAVVVSNTLLWANLQRGYVWIFLLCLVLFGALGLWDDWNKIKGRKGITARQKWWVQVFCAALISSLLVYSGISTDVSVPFFKNISIPLGLLFIPWAAFFIVGFSNAVNLTDGLDGLAIGSLLLNFATFSLITYIAGHASLAAYLHIPFAQTAELAIVGATLVGASLGFLWYNAYPAQIFMGDVGSLALGSVLALIALMAKQELLLVLSGGLFVAETLSVMVQVASYRYLGRRMFRMAPIHHHFELLGWPESKITVRFGIISVILCLLALMTLKIR
jgi:phospho-N-acetylmuramoyl-pentapeptide-transferase